MWLYGSVTNLATIHKRNVPSTLKWDPSLMMMTAVIVHANNAPSANSFVRTGARASDQDSLAWEALKSVYFMRRR